VIGSQVLARCALNPEFLQIVLAGIYDKWPDYVEHFIGELKARGWHDEGQPKESE
jgi:hypothetical protein